MPMSYGFLPPPDLPFCPGSFPRTVVRTALSFACIIFPSPPAGVNHPYR